MLFQAPREHPPNVLSKIIRRKIAGTMSNDTLREKILRVRPIWEIKSLILHPDLSFTTSSHLNCLKLSHNIVDKWHYWIVLCLSIVNFTACQLQQIEAALKRSSFTPVCKPDGSFKEIQCATTPTLNCWEVNREGKKIQDIDVTIHLTAHHRQQQLSKEKRIGVYPTLEEDEIGNICALIKIICH